MKEFILGRNLTLVNIAIRSSDTKLVAKITKGFIARNSSNSLRNERTHTGEKSFAKIYSSEQIILP